MILDAGPAWRPGAGILPGWCEALVQVPGWAHLLRAYSVDLPWRSSVEQRSQADELATRIAELAELGELAVVGGNWNSYGRADPVIPAALDSAPLHLRPSRMRYSPRDRTLTPNYDVHDVLASVGLEEAGAALASARSDPDDEPSGGTSSSSSGRLDRIYLTRELTGHAAGYVGRFAGRRGTAGEGGGPAGRPDAPPPSWRCSCRCPCGGGWLLLAFSAPLGPLAGAMMKLFDAIAATLRWDQ